MILFKAYKMSISHAGFLYSNMFIKGEEIYNYKENTKD